MNNEYEISFAMKDGTRIHLRKTGLARVEKDGFFCDVHHDTIINAVTMIEKSGRLAFIDQMIGPDSFSYTPVEKDKNTLTFVDETGKSVCMDYSAAMDFAADRLREYFIYLFDHVPSAEKMIGISTRIVGFVESVVLEDNDILNQEGWVLMRSNPLEIFHPQTGSKASGEAAEMVIEAMRQQRNKF